MVDYPVALPVDAVSVFLDKVKGKPVNVPELVHASWALVGYGLHLGLPVDQLKGAVAGADEMSEEAALIYVLDHGQNAGVIKQAGPLVGIALSIALKLALKFLRDELPKLLPID